jgi:hypothetical protein
MPLKIKWEGLMDAVRHWRAQGASWQLTADKVGVDQDALRKEARRRGMAMGRMNIGMITGMRVVAGVRPQRKRFQYSSTAARLSPRWTDSTHDG